MEKNRFRYLLRYLTAGDKNRKIILITRIPAVGLYPCRATEEWILKDSVFSLALKGRIMVFV
jgi:hypothetical protein